MRRILGDEFSLYEASFDLKPMRAFHINTKKISADHFCALSPFGETKAPHRDNCYYFSFDGIGKHPYHHAGMIYIQEPAAMFPVECVSIQPDWNVLDLCAAPGGKSSQIMQYLGNKGHLVSNEIVPSRCKMLTGNFERLGFKNTSALCAAPKEISQRFGAVFDLVVCDAPCSGEGMFRKETEAIPEWSEKNVIMCAERQREVLKEAVKCVKPGGFLLYSTCTFSEEENEENVMWLLKEYPQFVLVPVKSNIYGFTSSGTAAAGDKAELMRRFYPHISQGEGQFAALLQNTDTSCVKPKQNGCMLRLPDKKEDELIMSFLSSVLTDFNKDCFRINKDKLVYVDPEFFVPTDMAYMTGVTVGTLKKGRIDAHHQFFSAFGAQMKNRVELSLEDDRLRRYMSGESFSFSAEKGWCAVLVDGCALGGGKIVDGYLKNSYPRGLQIIK